MISQKFTPSGGRSMTNVLAEGGMATVPRAHDRSMLPMDAKPYIIAPEVRPTAARHAECHLQLYNCAIP